MNLIYKMIRSEEIKSDDEKVYETLDYYEMPLLLRSNNERCARDVESLFVDNGKMAAIFKEETHALISQFTVKGIAYVLLVGIPFADKYHDNPCLRLQEDIDFFIAEEDLAGATEILESNGYCRYNVNQKRKHITFIKKCTFANPILDKCPLIKVKLYRRITDVQFGKLTYSLFDRYVVEQQGVRIFNDEMALFHLIVHAHYYDFHPKILADVFMICKNGHVDWARLNDLLAQYGYVRTGMVMRDIIGRLGIGNWTSIVTHYDDIGILGDLYTSNAFWGDIFVRLDKFEMTRLRCFVYDSNDYMNLLGSFLDHNMCRRVSPMRSPLYICEYAD